MVYKGLEKLPMRTLNPLLTFSCACLFKTDFHHHLARPSDTEDLFGKSWGQGIIKQVRRKQHFKAAGGIAAPRL